MAKIHIFFVFLPPEKQGVVAQLVERMLRKHEVAGPTPVGSTKSKRNWGKKKHLTVWSSAFFVSTEGRDRTGTSVTSLVFETNASTDSATSAQNPRQKYIFFESVGKNCFRKCSPRPIWLVITSLPIFFSSPHYLCAPYKSCGIED